MKSKRKTVEGITYIIEVYPNFTIQKTFYGKREHKIVIKEDVTKNNIENIAEFFIEDLEELIKIEELLPNIRKASKMDEQLLKLGYS